MSPHLRAPDSECPACGAGLTPWTSVVGGEPSDPRQYELLRCAGCGTAVTAAHPPADAYESGVYSAREPRLGGVIARLQAAVLRQPGRILRRHVIPGGSVLDAGAGRGRLVGQLSAEGFDAHGIDPSARNIELASAAGAPVARAELERHEAQELDAVVLWHVLEHLDDPAEALSRAHGWLRPDGAILVGVPNLSSFQRRLAGAAWFHFDAPRHRVHFTRTGLCSLLERSGFEIVEEHHMVWQHNLHGMWFALLTRIGVSPGFPFHLAKRNIRPRPVDVALTALGLLLLPLALLLEALAAAGRRGGTVAVLSRASTAQAGRGRSAPR